MPTVSIIIAAYNRCKDLAKVMDTLLLQETEGRCVYEILVVDNNSTDGTKEMVMSYIPKFGSPQMKEKCLGLKYLFEPRQGKSYALNHGVQEVKGDIVAFTDDDVLVDPRWLFYLMGCFAKYHCDGVGGRVVPIYPDKTPQWIKDNPTKLAGVVVVADYGQETKPYGKPMDPFIGSNYAFKREVFDACGLFRLDLGPGTKTMGEDTEFIHRLVQQEKSLYYCGAALVRHPVDLNRLRLKYVIKWHMALGRFAAMNERFLLDGKKTAYYFGIPRYLFKGVFIDILFLVPSFFNRLSSYNRLRGLFNKLGKIAEYRRHARQTRGVRKERYG